MAEQSQSTSVDSLPIAFGNINEKNYLQLRALNQVTFPVKYGEQFYLKILGYQKFSRLAFFNDILIGGMTCREEMFDGKQCIYILTIGVLQAYRKYQVGSKLMEELIQIAQQDGTIKTIYLHMQVSNEIGLQFYKKHEFTIKETIQNYYEDIQPPHCYILHRSLE